MRVVLLMSIMHLLLLPPAFGRTLADGYGYPIPGSYAATIMGTPESLKFKFPEKIPTRDLELDLANLQDKPDVFFYDNGLRCTLAYQKKRAPLVFLIAGTGASHKSAKVVAMMKGLYQAGFHVITLASPTHPNFIINASRSHVPGDLREDSEDLYRAMEAAWREVRGDIEISGFCLSGYSLGGTQAAFVAKIDAEQGLFNFNRVLLVNPAVNLYESVTRIEDLLEPIPGGPKKIGRFFNRMLDRFVEYYREGDFVEINDEFLYQVYKANLVNTDEQGGLIALSFRINSAGMIFTSDVMTNGGYIVPKNRVLDAADRLDDYFRVGVHLSFLQYFDEYFFPHFRGKRPGLTRERLIHAQSLKSIEGYLRNNPRIGVISNDNDFILGPADLDYLRQLFGKRAKIYPRGGHLGNLEYRDNMEYMNDFVAFFNDREAR